MGAWIDNVGIEVIARRSAHADRCTILALATRPGVLRFFLSLEHEYFPPKTPMNDEFQLALHEWCDLPWNIVILPLVALDTARKVASETGMRLADGVPHVGRLGLSHILGSARSVKRFRAVTPLPVERVEVFPVDNPRAYTLENDKGSPVYLGGGDALIRAEERRWIAAFWKAHAFDPNLEPGRER